VERGIPALISITGPLGTGGKEAGTGGIRSVIEGGGTTHAGIRGTGGASDSGNPTAKGVMRERGSETLRSTGDLIAMVLVGEMGELLKTSGDTGAEDTRLIVLVCGNIVIPHLLAGRSGAGLSRAGVTGDFGSGGEGEGGDRIVTSAGSGRTGEEGRLRAQSLVRCGGGVVNGGAPIELGELSVVVYSDDVAGDIVKANLGEDLGKGEPGILGSGRRRGALLGTPDNPGRPPEERE